MSQFDESAWIKRCLYCAGVLVLVIIGRGIALAVFKGTE